jgi:hypothetical protein
MDITSLANGTVIGFAVNLNNGNLGSQNWYYVNMTDTLKAKTYYFLVGRYIKGQKTDFSINGALIGSSAVPNDSLARWPGHDYSAIGLINQAPLTDYWNGVIDDIRIYNRAISDSEVQALYHESGWPLSSQPKLELFYPFSSNANDSSGNGYNGTVVGATLTANRFGVASSAYSFDGSTSSIRCGDILDNVFSDSVAKFSISGWAMTRTYGIVNGGGGFIIGKNGGGSLGPYQWNVTHDEGVLYAAVFSDTLPDNYVALTSPMTKNQWFHFILIFDGSQPEMQRVKLYVNGQSSNSSIVQHVGTLGSSTVNSSQHLMIGATHYANRPDSLQSYYDGNIDDIRIYSGVISDSAIQALYHEGGWQIEGVTQVHGDVPADFELSPNYPNPFNPSTTIRFGVPVRSQVKIEIFNILGQRMSELVNAEVGPGYFEKVWQANYASGIYFYRIEAVSLSDPNKRFVSVRKMLLMK